MANKDKILATAQKFLQKNNLSRAIKEYLKVIAIDSKDVRSRQKLAELYSRSKNIEEALTHYEVVAAYYADNTFYLKAIAVYKQMQRLVPENLNYTLKLAQLNEQQGLVGNALSEYRALLHAYEVSEENEQAVKILDRMRELDPENITIGIRIAEFYARIGNDALAHESFACVEKQLKQLSSYKQLQNFYEHFMNVWRNDVDIHVGYGLTMVEHGEPLGGVQFLTKLQRQHPEDENVLFALSKGFHQCAEFTHEVECLERLIGWNKQNLDYYLSIFRAALACDDSMKALTYLELGKEFFFAEQRVAEIKPFYEQVRDLLPENRDVLTSLHAVYEQLGEGEKLFDVLSSDLGAEQQSSDGEFGGETFELQDTSPAIASDITFEELEFDTVSNNSVESSQEATFEDISFDLVEEEVASSGEENLFDLNFSDDDVAHVDIQADLEEADFYLQQGLLEEAQQVSQRLATTHPDHSGVVHLKEQIAQRRESAASQAVPDIELNGLNQTTEVSIDLDLGGIDLSLEETNPVESFDFHNSTSDIENSIDELHAETTTELRPELADSQRGVVTVITDDDTESSYNLGIAYKEMGLLDDAIAEFDKAINSPSRKLDCISLKAACYVDQQKFDEAESVLTSGLSDSALTIKDQVLLYYETGLLYEAWHRYADALSSYQVVADNDPQFRSVTVKIGELKILVDDSDMVSETNRVSYL